MLIRLSSFLRPPYWKMSSFHLPPAERGNPPRTSWCRPGADAAILEKNVFFSLTASWAWQSTLNQSVHTRCWRPPFWKNVVFSLTASWAWQSTSNQLVQTRCWCRHIGKCRLFTYRQLSMEVHLAPVGADQVPRPPFWKMSSFHLPPAERGSPPRTSWCRPGAVGRRLCRSGRGSGNLGTETETN